MSNWWFLSGLAIFLIGLTKSGFGAGAGLMIVPMTAIALSHTPGQSAEAALPLLLPLLIFGDLFAIYQYRHLFGLKIVAKLLPGTIVGVLVGSLLLRWFAQQQKEVAEALINIDIGLESVLLVSLHWWRVARTTGQRPAYVPRPWQSHLVGAFAGISSTLAHAAGPIITLYLLPQKIDRKLFVGTCALYFFIVNAAKLPGYTHAGLFAQASPRFALQFLPLVIAGAVTGFWMNRRLNDKVFSKLVYVLTFVLGWYILQKGIRQFVH